MQVLALVSDGFGGRGGIARYNTDFLTALAASNAVDTVTVLPRLAPDIMCQFSAKVHQRAPIFHRLPYSVAALRSVSYLRRDDVIFCGHILMAPLAAALSRLVDAPMWLQVHGIDAWSPPTRHVRWGAETARLVTAVSRFTRSQMIANWWNGDPSRIRVLPNTVGREFRPGAKPPHLVKTYGLTGRKVLLSVARLSCGDRYKGLQNVIAALPEIRARYPEALYLVVGDGDDGDRLRRFAEERGVADHVRFAGYVPDTQLPDYYRAADVYIMPSKKEGFGIVFLEAAASGLPVIAGNCDGSVDALAEGAIGVLIDPQDLSQLITAVRCAFEHGPEAAISTAVERFATQYFNAHVDDLVRSLH